MVGEDPLLSFLTRSAAKMSPCFLQSPNEQLSFLGPLERISNMPWAPQITLVMTLLWMDVCLNGTDDTLVSISVSLSGLSDQATLHLWLQFFQRTLRFWSHLFRIPWKALILSEVDLVAVVLAPIRSCALKLFSQDCVSWANWDAYGVCC